MENKIEELRTQLKIIGEKFESMRSEHAMMINALMACLGIKIIRKGMNEWGYQLINQVPENMRGLLVKIVQDVENIKEERKFRIIRPNGDVF